MTIVAAKRYDGTPVNTVAGVAVCNLCALGLAGPRVDGCECCPHRAEASGVIRMAAVLRDLQRKSCVGCGGPVDCKPEDATPLCLNCDPRIAALLAGRQ